MTSKSLFTLIIFALLGFSCTKEVREIKKIAGTYSGTLTLSTSGNEIQYDSIGDPIDLIYVETEEVFENAIATISLTEPKDSFLFQIEEEKYSTEKEWMWIEGNFYEEKDVYQGYFSSTTTLDIDVENKKLVYQFSTTSQNEYTGPSTRRVVFEGTQEE